jgi:Tol biopolymer transport system component
MRRKRLATLAGAIALLGFGAVTAAPAHATFPGANGKIAFSRNGEIFVMTLDGAEVTRLTSFGDLSCPNAFSPAWSPNGEKIAYVHCGRSGFSLHVMNADGSRDRRVTEYGRGIVQPAVWSPNGRKIAFADDLVDADPRVGAIIVVRADGTRGRRLAGYRSLNVHPSWSPDGKKIAFTSDRDGDGDIFVMNADGTGKTKLTDNTVLDETPAWSPDGSRIVFDSTVPGPPGQGDAGSALHSMNPDGTDLTALTDGTRFDGMPAWSPDSTRILFRGDSSAGQTTSVDIYVINPDGTGETKLTGDQTVDVEADWSPDGTMIAFMDDYTAIYVINADGTEQTRITNERGSRSGVDWQALPT